MAKDYQLMGLDGLDDPAPAPPTAPLVVVTGGAGSPEEPDWRLIYSDPDDVVLARTEWGKVVRELRDTQTLTTANGHAVRRLVEFRVQYERAALQVAQHGAVVQVKRGPGAGQWNLHWSVMRQAHEAIQRAEAELGIAPVRRGKAAKVQKRDKAARASDAYLKPAKD